MELLDLLTEISRYLAKKDLKSHEVTVLELEVMIIEDMNEEM